MVPESVQKMLDDPQAPTAPLDDFLSAYEDDDNLWWYLNSGHHQNLFEMAVDRADEIRDEERRKIGDAIQKVNKNWYTNYEKLGALVGPGMVASAYQQCERLARGGGVDG